MTTTRHPAGPATQTSDTDLVLRARAGDSSAFGELYRRYQPYIAKILNDDVNDRASRDDLMQTSFEKAFAKLNTLRDPSAFRPWLGQLTRRVIVDHFRHSSRTVSVDFTDPESGLDAVSTEWSADEWAEMRDLAAMLKVGISGLTPRDATVLELATTFGFSAQEIAAALDIDAGHARVLLHRARRRLSNEIAERYTVGAA